MMWKITLHIKGLVFDTILLIFTSQSTSVLLSLHVHSCMSAISPPPPTHTLLPGYTHFALPLHMPIFALPLHMLICWNVILLWLQVGSFTNFGSWMSIILGDYLHCPVFFWLQRQQSKIVTISCLLTHLPHTQINGKFNLHI